uniref:Uncharacterized protein n=1 Tax=Tanacetum cinerariifolium TaxID=118510 RepID=A0A699TYE3_TANCI|nr:hypothetical protein [Tanacetum cinerariifolium]
MKKKRQMNFIVTSILSSEEAYKYLKILKTLTYGVHFDDWFIYRNSYTSPKSTMTPSIMTTTTTASQPPIPATPIPSDILQTLPTFASLFRFED